MLELRIQQHFIDSADLKYQAAQALGKPIADAVQAVLACITSGGKMLACGSGASSADAQQFAAFCVAGFERERPELAAVALSGDAALLHAVANNGDLAQLLARQGAQRRHVEHRAARDRCAYLRPARPCGARARGARAGAQLPVRWRGRPIVW